MSKLSTLPNVGKILEQNLLEIGITTPEELREIGTKAAFLRIRSLVDPGACLHMLYGLQGAVEGVRDCDLAADTKTELKEFFHHL